MSEDLGHQMNAEDTSFASRMSKSIRPGEPNNSKNKKNNRYFTPFDGDDVTVFEQGNNLLQAKTKNFSVSSDPDESVPLNV